MARLKYMYIFLFYFKTNRIDQWKDTILSFFGEFKSCILKGGSVIKVTFDIKGKSYVVKINFYKTGSVVLQGAKCTKFTEMYFGTLKSRLKNKNQPHQESEPLKAGVTVPNIPESKICEARLTDNTPMSPTLEINSVQDSETPILKRLTP